VCTLSTRPKCDDVFFAVYILLNRVHRSLLVKISFDTYVVSLGRSIEAHDITGSGQERSWEM
jgi:hypothetical protein